MKLDYFLPRTLYRFRTILAEAMADGITDVRALSMQIEAQIAKTTIETRTTNVPWRKQKRSKRRCPACDFGLMTRLHEFDGVFIKSCSARCGYSEVVK